MMSPRLASLRLVLGVALLVFLTGCATYTGNKAPEPVASSSSDAVPVATSGLRMGYVWQPASGNLYPILGVTGAAHYGSAALSGNAGLAQAAAITTPSGDWALELGTDGVLRQWTLSGQAGTSLSANLPGDSQIWFSPSGTSAAVISPSSPSRAVVVTGLPAKPQLSAVSLPGGFVSGDAAVSDTGAFLVGVNRPGVTGIDVGLLSASQSYTPIAHVQAWGGAAFVPGQSSSSAVIADAGAAQLTLLSGLTGSSPALANVPLGGMLQRASGVAASADGKWAYIGDAGKSQILRAALSGATTPTAISCACTPQQMIPLTSDGIFSLTRNTAGQADWILDTRAAEPRTVFIPANPSPTTTTASASSTKP